MKTIVALLLLAWLMPVAAATEEWKAYPYPDAGFAIQLPAAPTVEKSTFKTSAGVSLPMTRYVVRQDRSVYTLNIVDYSTTTADAMTTIAEIESSSVPTVVVADSVASAAQVVAASGAAPIRAPWPPAWESQRAMPCNSIRPTDPWPRPAP
jgi:hypothetical protein